MTYLYAFLVGGLLCAIGQLLIDFTKLTPARILVSYVVAGCILGGLGWYEPLVKTQIAQNGFSGIITGGLTAAAGGISAAMLFAFLFALFFRSKPK